MKSKLIPIICAAGLALPLSSYAAVVTWGGWTAVTNNTQILTPAGYTYGGVNFNGSNTTVNNGTQDVVFTGIARNASGATNGISVGSTDMAFDSNGSGNSNVVSAVGAPQTWATVLDRVIGDFDNSATITLSDLTIGTEYTVQFFSSTPDANLNQTTTITSGGVQTAQFGAHGKGETRYNIASFKADGTSQSFSINGDEPTFGALVIGTKIPEPSAALLGGLGLLGMLRRRRN